VNLNIGSLTEIDLLIIVK